MTPEHDSAFPTDYRTQSGLSKREYAAIHILQGLLSADPKDPPSLEDVWKLADELLKKGKG